MNLEVALRGTGGIEWRPFRNVAMWATTPAGDLTLFREPTLLPPDAKPGQVVPFCTFGAGYWLEIREWSGVTS